MNSNNWQKASTASALAFILTVAAASAQAVPPMQKQASLFELSEVQGIQVAMKGTNQQCASQTSENKGNPIVNNKFTEHVCAAHVFHPKRKAMEKRDRKAKEQQCASKIAPKVQQ